MRNSKDKCTKKVCELLVEKKITILFITAIVLSICFLCVPLLLKCQCIYENVQKILASLGNYKSSYFEACGAMIGTFLAVTSAIWIQQKSEEKQKADIIKKNATIIYWDIKMFYRENDILASRIQDELKQLQENKQTEEDVIKKFMFLREYSGVYIDANWISTVAE